MITAYRNFLRWIANYQTDAEILKSAHFKAFVKAMEELDNMMEEEK